MADQDVGTMIGTLQCDVAPFSKSMNEATRVAKQASEKIQNEFKAVNLQEKFAARSWLDQVKQIKKQEDEDNKNPFLQLPDAGTAIAEFSTVGAVAVAASLAINSLFDKHEMYNRELKRSTELHKEQMEVLKEHQHHLLQEANALSGVEKAHAFQEMRQQAEVNLQGIEDALKRAEKTAKESTPGIIGQYSPFAGARAEHQLDTEQVKQLKDQEDAAKKYALQLRDIQNEQTHLKAVGLASKWKEEADTLGMTNTEAHIYELRLAGVAGADLAAARAAGEHLEHRKALAQAQKENEAAANQLANAEFGLLHSMETQLATHGMEKHMAKVQEFLLSHQNVSAQVAATMQREAGMLAAQEAADEKLKEAKKLDTEETKKAAEIMRHAESPMEKYMENIAEITALVNHHKLTSQEAQKAVEALEDEFVKHQHKLHETQFQFGQHLGEADKAHELFALQHEQQEARQARGQVAGIGQQAIQHAKEVEWKDRQDHIKAVKENGTYLAKIFGVLEKQEAHPKVNLVAADLH